MIYADNMVCTGSRPPILIDSFALKNQNQGLFHYHDRSELCPVSLLCDKTYDWGLSLLLLVYYSSLNYQHNISTYRAKLDLVFNRWGAMRGKHLPRMLHYTSSCNKKGRINCCRKHPKPISSRSVKV